MEAEVGLGDEWLSESSGSLGVTVSVGRTQPLPRLCPSACLAVPSGHFSQAQLAEGRAPYGCL